MKKSYKELLTAILLLSCVTMAGFNAYKIKQEIVYGTEAQAIPPEQNDMESLSKTHTQYPGIYRALWRTVEISFYLFVGGMIYAKNTAHDKRQ